ncbi:MAG: aldehyde ferredoxin oxidoreductase [Desulfurococcales archaeon]|nr:aldehyde ferredoxin oxidoreductase [Desulfurococcales archaeon]
MEYRVLAVDAGTAKARELVVDATGPIHAGVDIHFSRRTWERHPLDPGNVLLIGGGPFTISPLIGANRLTALFRSPVSMGLHASTLGGAAYALARTGFDAVMVEGESKQPLIISVLAGESGYEVKYYWLEHNELARIYKGYGGYKGTRALHVYTVDLLSDRLRGLEYRVLVVGPAAWTTVQGGIFSWIPDSKGRPTPVVDSASRGGGGSVLAQAHGVAAIIVGGPRRVPVRRADAKAVVERAFGKSYFQVVKETTTKYRYDPRLGTGGTFGVNYVHYRELIPALAYNTIYMSRSVRLLLHEKIIKHFWRPFQEVVFPRSGPKPWRTCGEPCSVACKKVWNNVKLDYEPAHAMGPMIGVITLSDTARLVEIVDDLGLDAIETGHVVAWLFDSLARGLLERGELGIDGIPVMDPIQLTPETSRLNARLAEQVITSLVMRDKRIPAIIAQEGARQAASILDEEHSSIVKARGVGFKDLLVYAAFGRQGYMTPNYYWSPGLIAPLYVLGRYWTNYSPSYAEPREYARTSFTRALRELLIDNAGMCRFHRKWAEKVLQHLYEEVLSYHGDLLEHARSLYRRIALYNQNAGAEPVPWESRKTMDIVATIAAEIGVKGWEEIPEREKMLAWWEEFYQEIRSLLGLQ